MTDKVIEIRWEDKIKALGVEAGLGNDESTVWLWSDDGKEEIWGRWITNQNS